MPIELAYRKKTPKSKRGKIIWAVTQPNVVRQHGPVMIFKGWRAEQYESKTEKEMLDIVKPCLRNAWLLFWGDPGQKQACKEIQAVPFEGPGADEYVMVRVETFEER